MSSLYALGLNHQTAPLEIRERVVFHVERLGEALSEVKRGLASEAAILSTCNRTELYFEGEQPGAAAQWLAQYHSIAPDELSPYLYTLSREQAVRHAFRVASRLDSMVLGEPPRASLQRPRHRAQGPRRGAARARHRRVLHCLLVADPRQGTGRTGAACPAAAADVHGRSRRAARHRARGRRARRCLPVHSR